MTEPLGQSQVLPYLRGLADRGVELEIISFEPAATDAGRLEAVRDRMRHDGLLWRPLVRGKSAGLSRKLWESANGVAHGLAAALVRRPDIVHARSYLPAAVADAIATLAPRAKLLFDCRGMLGDEYVDSGYWARDGLQYRLLKRVERRLFARSEGIVLLTNALRRWLEGEHMVGASTTLAVIPCCVDTEHFRSDAAVRADARRRLGVEDRLVLAYAGSLGSYYQEADMARFAGALAALYPRVTFLALSRSPTGKLEELVRSHGVHDFRAVAVFPEDMARTLPAADLGLSFILPCFSKMGSSPTKVAEYLASGVPVVLNANIGDQAELASDPDACVVLSSFEDAEIARAAREALAIAARPYEVRAQATRRVTDARFSLAKLGVPRYADLYEGLVRLS